MEVCSNTNMVGENDKYSYRLETAGIYIAQFENKAFSISVKIHTNSDSSIKRYERLGYCVKIVNTNLNQFMCAEL